MAKSNSKSNQKNDPQADKYLQKLVTVRRTTSVTKGGRELSFSALIVTGCPEEGVVGFGLGKSKEVPLAIQKATEQARRGMVKINLKGTTIQHEMMARHGASRVFMKPASDGTGVIAGNAMRAVFEVVGIENILAKSIGSPNPINVVRATINGLRSMATPESVAKKRGKKVEEILEGNHDS